MYPNLLLRTPSTWVGDPLPGLLVDRTPSKYGRIPRSSSLASGRSQRKFEHILSSASPVYRVGVAPFVRICLFEQGRSGHSTGLFSWISRRTKIFLTRSIANDEGSAEFLN